MKIRLLILLLIFVLFSTGCEKKSDGEAATAPEISNTTHLIDVNQSPIALSSSPNLFRQIGSRLFFTADDGVHGRELWVKDPAGIRLVADINPNGSSNVGAFVEFTGKIYFTADDGVHGLEWWRSDGVNTELVKDIWPGRRGGAGAGALVGGNWLFFTANDGVTGSEMWRTDGEHVERVTDIYAPENNDGMSLLASLGGWVYFSAYARNSGAFALWRTDGSTTEEILTDTLEPVPVGYIYGNDNTLSINNEPYFISAGKLVHVSGNGVAHVVVSDLGNNGSQIYVAAFDNKIYFTKFDTTHGNELWVWDGNAISLVSEIAPNAASSNPYHLIVVDGWLYFNANDHQHGHSLWRTRGTIVQRMTDTGPQYAWEIATLGDWVYFIARDTSGSENLWRSNSNGSTMEKVSDTSENYPNYSFPGFFVKVGEWIYFSKFNGNGARRQFELWRTNAANTLEKVVQKGGSLDVEIGNLYAYFQSNGELYFVGRSSSAGDELWRVDSSGASLLFDINAGKGTRESDPYLRSARQFNGKLYFFATDDALGRGLFRTDGTVAEPVRTYGNSTDYWLGEELAEFEGWLYFSALDDTGLAGEELWRTNGQGIVEQFADLYTGEENSSRPRNFMVVGDSLYFTAEDRETGRELWRLHAGKVERVTDINAGRGDSDPSNFIQWDGWLYFTVGQSQQSQLWRTRGVDVELIGDINRGPGVIGPVFTLFKGHIYYVSYDAEHGSELWRASPAANSGQLFHDTVDGANGEVAENSFMIIGDKMYYFSRDSGHMVLWYTDGNDKTKVDLSSTGADYFFDFVAYNGWLYFMSSDSADKRKLFRVDGVSVQQVTIESLGKNYSYPSNFKVVGNRLYFFAETQSTSVLLYSEGDKIMQLSPNDDYGDPIFFYGGIFDFNGRMMLVQTTNNSTTLWTENQGKLVELQRTDEDGEFYAGYDQFTVIGDRLYYVADDHVHGRELWYYQP